MLTLPYKSNTYELIAQFLTFKLKGKKIQPGVIAHCCYLSTLETEAGGSYVEGQPGLHIKED